MGSESEEKKEMLIINGNAFYDSAPGKENRQDQFPEYER